MERGLAVLELSRGGWPVVNEEGFPVSNLPENIRYAFGQIGVDAYGGHLIFGQGIAEPHTLDLFSRGQFKEEMF